MPVKPKLYNYNSENMVGRMYILGSDEECSEHAKVINYEQEDGSTEMFSNALALDTFSVVVNATLQ